MTKPRRERRRSLPWEEIRVRYIQGTEVTEASGAVRRVYPSTGDLAREYDIHPSMISRTARTRDARGRTWEDHRKVFQERLRRKAAEMVLEKLAERQAAHRVQIIQSFHLAGQMARRRLLSDELTADELCKTVATLRQSLDGSEEAMRLCELAEPEKEMDDWTFMHLIREGARLEDLVDPDEEDAA